jgi:4-hydroxy-4-methyl-2-oxoglutarate aldolase
LSGTPTSFVADAQGGRGGIDYRVKPLDGGSPATAFCGIAVTCYCGPADNLALFAAVEVARPGDVIVAATDQFTGTSLTGDLLVAMAKNRGVRALVTDGLVRDVEGILRVGIPVYCRGVIPNSPARNGPGTVGLPITLGGICVDSGDIVVGDRDGIVVVARDSADRVVKELAGVRAAESLMEKKVQAGLEVPDHIRALLDSDQVREVD